MMQEFLKCIEPEIVTIPSNKALEITMKKELSVKESVKDTTSTNSYHTSSGCQDCHDTWSLVSNDTEIACNATTKTTGHVLSWSSVNMKLKSSTKKSRQMLYNINGILLPGQLTAIMGHSGAGKTTLLKVLAGKIRSSGNISVSYDIQLDGKRVVPSDISVQRKIAFVAQKDVLFRTATPREAIRFSARLRLNQETSDDTVEQLTTSILGELGLIHVADSKIAGLSGGEMRRTSLGVELVVRPSIVLLDEVTSGLDSYNAMQVLSVLKKVSDSGASVLFTLHQPNSQMFAAIDHLILMHHGRCMYQGTVGDIKTYFADRGYAVPEDYNPADWIIMVSEGMSSTEELKDSGFFENFPGQAHRRDSCEILVSSSASLGRDKPSKQKKFLFDSQERKNRISMSTEIGLLLIRGWYNLIRDCKLLILRFAIIGLGAVIVAVVFAGVCDDVIESVLDFQSHLGAVFFLCMAGSIIPQVILLEFIDQREIILREFSTNHYRMASYTISKLAIEGLSVFLQILLFLLIVYWSLGLQGRFWYLLLCFYAYGMAGASAAVALGSYTNDPRSAKELIPMIMLPQLLFCGFFVSLSSIPVWLRWLQWVMPLTYTFRLVANEEFCFCRSDSFGPELLCHTYLEAQSATDEFTFQYWGALIGTIFLQQVFALFFLRRKMQVNESA